MLATAESATIEHPIRKNGSPVKLLESEDYEFQLNAQNSEIQSWNHSIITKAVVEDSRGKEYKVAGLVDAIVKNAEHLQAVS